MIFFLALEIKDYNVVIDDKTFFDQPVENDLITYENIRKLATGQGDDYTTGCLLDYIYFKKLLKAINNKHLMLIQKQYSRSVLLQV